jgi:hypothetical protein
VDIEERAGQLVENEGRCIEVDERSLYKKQCKGQNGGDTKGKRAGSTNKSETEDTQSANGVEKHADPKQLDMCNTDNQVVNKIAGG